MKKKLFRLVHGEARKRAIQAIGEAPDGYVCTISEPKRSLDQNAMIHATLQEIGDQMGWMWAGTKIDIDDLKSIFVAAYRKATGSSVRFVPGIDGQPVILNWRTRDFSKAEGSDFIDFVLAWRANDGDG